MITLLKGNDPIAFEEVYTRYWSRLYLAAYNLLRDQAISQDIVQDIFTSLWVRRHKLRDDTALAGYLHAAVRNQVLKQIRAGRRLTHLLDQISTLSAGHTTEEGLLTKEIQAMLEQHMQQLPDKCRQVFHLSRSGNLSTKEIALKLSISPKTVENQLTKALRHLRFSLKEFFLILLLFLLGNL